MYLIIFASYLSFYFGVCFVQQDTFGGSQAVQSHNGIILDVYCGYVGKNPSQGIFCLHVIACHFCHGAIAQPDGIAFYGI